MSARLRPGDDPDLQQAIVDLAPVFAQLREAKAQLRKLGPSGNLNNVGRARSALEDASCLIETRAARIGVDAVALRAILSTDAHLRQRQRRRPSRSQMLRELGANAAAARRDAEVARQELARAQHMLESAVRAEGAAALAQRIYGGGNA